MVGTLQDETDRLRIECETLKHEVQQLKTNVAIKNAEQDRWIEERSEKFFFLEAYFGRIFFLF